RAGIGGDRTSGGSQRRVTLGIQIAQEHALAAQCEGCGEVDGGGSLAATPLLVQDGERLHRGAPSGTPVGGGAAEASPSRRLAGKSVVAISRTRSGTPDPGSI